MEDWLKHKKYSWLNIVKTKNPNQINKVFHLVVSGERFTTVNVLNISLFCSLK